MQYTVKHAQKSSGWKTEKFESWYLWLKPFFVCVCVVWSFVFFFNDCSINNETRLNLVVDFSLWIRTLILIKKRFSLSVVGRKGVGRGVVTPYIKYNGRYVKAPPERDTFPAQASAISKDREFMNRIIWKGKKTYHYGRYFERGLN